MVSIFTKSVLVNLFFPLLLLTGAILRPSFISLGYVILALLCSWLPTIKLNKPFPRTIRVYTIACVFLTLSTTICQFAYQLYQHLNIPNDEAYVKFCNDSYTDFWLRQIGLIRVPITTNPIVFRLFLPEVFALLASTITLVVCVIYPTDMPPFGFGQIEPLEGGAEEGNQMETELAQQQRIVPSTSRGHAAAVPKKLSDSIIAASKIVTDASVIIAISVLGISNPSLLNLPYFLFFLLVFTWWALYTPLGRKKFNILKKVMIFYLAVHFVLIFAYQIEYFRQVFEPHSLFARLLGLHELYVPLNCDFWYRMNFNFAAGSLPFVHIAVVFILFHAISLQLRWTRSGIKRKQRAAIQTINSRDRETRNPEDNSLQDQEELLPGSQRESADITDAAAVLQRMTSQVMDRQKISQLIKSDNETEDGSILVRLAQEFLFFCLYHCYVFALLSMMTWALVFHSVFGLIFLISTCVLWAHVNSRKWTFHLSPMLLAYVEFLLLAQYLYSLNLRNDELYTSDLMQIIGFQHPADRIDAFASLALKTLLSLPIFILLRLHLREVYYNSLSARERLRHINYGTFDIASGRGQCQSCCGIKIAGVPIKINEQSPFINVTHLLTKYWIFLVAFCLLINSPLLGKDNLFTLGFFIFFVVLLLTLNASFRLFRKVLFCFLTVLIIYASVILVLNYCYQFPGVPNFWRDLTHLSDQATKDIGLKNYENKIGSVKLILLIVVTMLQLKFFHHPWMELVKTPTPSSPAVEQSSSADTPPANAPRIGSGILSTLMKAKTEFWIEFKRFCWRFVEVHFYRLILLLLLLICLEHFCLLNFVPVFLISIALCLHPLSKIITFFLCLYLALELIGRTIYKLSFIPPIENIDLPLDRRHIDDLFNVSGPSNESSHEFNTTARWIGLEKSPEAALPDLLCLLLVLVLLGLQLSIRYRQIYKRKMLGQSEPPAGIVFPNAQPKELDKNLRECAKFLLNYGFYKFGVEISFSAIVFAAWLRMDFLAAVYMIWLLLFIPLSRQNRKFFWPFFVVYLAIVLPLQYAMAIGFPENWGIDYPWSNWNPLFDDNVGGWSYLSDNLLYFLGLPNYRMKADRFVQNIVADFIILAIVAAQHRVFCIESEDHPAGSNNSIYGNGKYVLHKENPHYDFISEQRSFVDFFKFIIFMYGHWITMIMVLCAGLGGTSLFALGYVILAFWMLWQGNNLYTMRNYSKTLSRWNFLAFYTATVMLCKIALQLFGCVFIGMLNTKNGCSVQQLFSIFCINSLEVSRLNEFFKNLPEDDKEFKNFQTCSKDSSEAMIGFDAFAFLFIVFQLRILHSWYFQHSMIEFRCEVIQANRGAILINQLIEKEMREQTEQQDKKLREIKNRTAAIRKRYEEQQKRNSGIVSGGFFSPQTYSQAKRAGDYYMFDYDPETDELTQPVQSFVPEVTPGAGDFDKLDPAQLLHAALGRDLNLASTLDSVEQAEQIKDEKLRMIAAIAPSKKARAIAKKALYQRHHPEQHFDFPIPEGDLEEEIVPSTSGIQKEEVETTDLGLGVRMRRKKDEKEVDESEIQLMKNDEQKAEEGSDEEKKSKGWGKAMLSIFRFIWKIFLSILDWAAAFLNRRSREHRYVAYVLNKEKERLKGIMSNDLYDGQVSSSELRDRWGALNMNMVSSQEDIRRLESEAHNRWEERNIYARFITAIGNCISAHTDLLCYAFAVFVHGWTAGLLTIPLPALVFLWGTLASPRPSKFFWIALIVYTEIEIVIKFTFQFGLWSWNQLSEETRNSQNVYKTQYVLGIQKVPYFAVPDVALLISLFFHRYMLRKLGLWRDANSDRLLAPQKLNGNGSPRVDSQGTESTYATAHSGQGQEQILQSQELDMQDIDLAEKGETRKGSSVITEEQQETKPLPTKKGGVLGHFVQKLIYPKFRYILDLYPLMFFLDVLCMLITAFGYSSFGEGGTGDVVSDIKSNRIPIMLVVIILIQSLMIVIDRGLYLRKAVIAKLIYHIISLVVVHVWIFFILPLYTQKEAFDNRVARIVYYIKCIYFLISAWQIRNGYPSLCVGNLLTHSYGLLNMILFKIFMLTPFVFELRTAIDWTWTDTSMPIFDYFNMENFYAVIYNLKCARKYEESFPAPRGEAKGTVIKYLMGFPMILALIILIWSPIIAFAFINTIGNISPPETAILTVSIEGFPYAYKMEATGSELQPLTAHEYDILRNNFSDTSERPQELNTDLVERIRMAVAFINQYTSKDILKVKFRPESETLWQITQNSRAALLDMLKNTTEELEMTYDLQFIRPRTDPKKDPATHSYSRKVKVNNGALMAVINGTAEWVEVLNALPTYLNVPSQGEAQTAVLLQKAAERRQSMDERSDYENHTFNNWRMRLINGTDNNAFWLSQVDFNENITKLTKIPSPEKVNYGVDRNLNYTQFLALVDRVFPSWLNEYVSGGVILMYAGIVLLVGRLLRGFVSSQPLDVIINEIPNPDHLLKICLDIYLVREARDFTLEQDLFSKLIFLFRSPQTLIRWTRHKNKPE